MAAKVRMPDVSYGIGVQNRYSAFLDDDEGLVSSVRAVDLKGNNTEQAGVNSKAQLKTSSAHPPAPKGGQSKPSNKAPKSSQEKQLPGSIVPKQQRPNGLQQNRTDSRRQPRFPNQKQQSNGSGQANQVGRQQFANGRPRAANQEDHANNNNQRFNRGGQHYSNGNNNHNQYGPSNAQGQAGSFNKENHQSGEKFSSRQDNNHQFKRSFNTSHQFESNNERKSANVGEEGQALSASEEVKQRRQQKRALDLKYKNPEKVESRRHQTNNTQLEHQHQQVEPADDQADGSRAGQGAFRNRRRFGDGQRGTEDANRGSDGPRNGRIRRDGHQAGETNGTSGDTRAPRGERQPRNRNGFGFGSRGSRGEDSGKFDRAKPIPNFSNKLDFPSLAS